MALLEIKNFNKSFGQTEVLKGIDLAIDKGEVISIIGSSGSGKTTLLRCINLLEKPDLGVMTLEGEELYSAEKAKDYKDKDLREKRLNLGLVFQSFNLFPQYSVRKNITLAPYLLLKDKAKEYKNSLKSKASAGEISKKEIKPLVLAFKSERKAEIEKECTELLEKVGLIEKENSYPCELSGGQCQRVAIARALALKPKILCFDEPTSALDPELTGEVLKVIKSLRQDGRTMIIVTHEMNFAKGVSDKIIYMSDGVVEEMGTPKEVFENTKSEKLKAFLKSGENN